MAVLDQLKRAWNAFRYAEEDPLRAEYTVGASSYSASPPDRKQFRYTNERSIITSIYNRISIDVADIEFRHVKLDEIGRFEKEMDSPLNTCFQLEANLDQGPRSFRQDHAMTLFDNGVSAIVPVDTSPSPAENAVFDIYTLRVGQIVEWFPQHVKVKLYNEKTGLKEEITLEKRYVAIVENPLYAVMNEPNSTLQRLIRKLNLLDTVDEASSSGKLDLIVQLPYVIKSEARRNQAEKRREDVETQLKGSKYGIAYIDGTEKVTQLNRPAENNLLKQVEYLTIMLYGQLGITEEVMNGTADEKTMINYYNRTVKPIVDTTVEEMQRAFLGQPGTRRLERIYYYRDPFKLVTVADMAEIGDKFTRNEIFTANEIRGFMGVAPSTDPKADKLFNSNMPIDKQQPLVD